MERAGSFICTVMRRAAAAVLAGFIVYSSAVSRAAYGGEAASLQANSPCSGYSSGEERRMLIPGGMPFGIKLRTDGVMVVSVNKGSPAAKAGIRAGDIILSVNGSTVETNAEIAAAIQQEPSGSEVVYLRRDSEKCVSVTPQSADGRLILGVWVRDSAAGIGTLTYYDPETGSFGGLGHPVSDVTTGELMPLASGEITEAEIFGVTKSADGEPGELCGELCSGAAGTLEANTPVGVFGTLSSGIEGKVLPVAHKSEVECGEAVILSTISGTEPQEYEAEIEKINLCALNGTKSMIIRITDERLLETAGGIVRGMSGSPIIQNGMLVGAVTHVFLNDPTRGYAVFAETMVEEQGLTVDS